jgi:regulator of cell morphogenesis and NO signaling
MNLDPTRPLKEIVAEMPWSARVFEKLGIDFCCDGRQTLEEACRKAGLLPDEVLGTLEQREHLENTIEWDAASLNALMKHIVERHHAFCRQELSRLSILLADAVRAHAGSSPELAKLQKCFAKMSSELMMHLVKEEQTLFPLIARMEEAAAHQQALPMLPFGSIQNPIGMMVFEHDETGVDLKQMRELSKGFNAPADAEPAIRALYEGLKAFEKDMHEHVFLENYILFPRAAALEKRTARSSAAS